MTKKIENTAVAVSASNEALALLKQSFPAEVGFDRILLPRLAFSAQDKFEGEGKAKKCVVAAGTFFIEKETGESNAEGKSVWSKEEIGPEIDATIIYSRKQLKYYDQNLETFTSSPIFDEDTDIIPLFCGGAKVMEGTVAELKKRYEYKDDEGKIKSKLEDNKILYVLYDGEVYQLCLRGSSMWSFKSFARTTSIVPAQLTRFSSEAKTKGQVSWNQMSFTKIRDLNAEEVDDIQDRIDKIRGSIAAEKAYYAKEKAIDATPIPYPVEDSSAGAKSFA